MKNFKRLGMVVAMREELLSFLSGSNIQIENETVSNYNVCKFTVDEKQVFVVESGMGKIHASAATQFLISHYNVQGIINFGVCGTLCDNLGVLDSVLVDEIVSYDFDVSPITDLEVGQHPGYDKVISCKNMFLDLATKLHPDLKTVRCASGDKFVHLQEVKDDLNKNFGAQICEMECAAVAITSMTNNLPFLIMKAVSDGKGGAQEFQEMLNSASSQCITTVLNMLKTL